jgi:hypothetical protein
MRFLVLLSICAALLMAGCKPGRSGASSASARTPATVDFKARLDAAKGITFANERDQALAAVAKDAARGGEASVTKQAVANIMFTTAKDETAADCALKLAAAGQGAAANDVARMITFTTVRDATLKKLAAGNH